MPANKKPRKKHRPRVLLTPTNLIGYVKEAVSLPSEDQIDRITTNFNTLIERFLNGDAPVYQDWDTIRTMLMVSQEIEKQGAVRKLQGEIDAIGEVIYDVFDTFVEYLGDDPEAKWVPKPFTQAQKDELFWFKKLFRFQLENLSVAEYSQCVDRVSRQRASWPKQMKERTKNE